MDIIINTTTVAASVNAESNEVLLEINSGENITIEIVGAAGAAGQGVPTGGTTGQALFKSSDDDYDAEWGNVPNPDLSQYAHLDGAVFTGEVSVPDVAYSSSWDEDLSVPTKSAIYDKIEAIPTYSLSTITYFGGL